MVALSRPPVILLVEDEWILRVELADTLSAQGWTVVESSSAEHALGLLSRGDHFDLLVTDIRLGGPVLGWDVAIAWRKRGAGMPVVYVSANDPNNERRVPGSVFLSKPIMLSAFVKSCRDLLKSTEN